MGYNPAHLRGDRGSHAEISLCVKDLASVFHYVIPPRAARPRRSNALDMLPAFCSNDYARFGRNLFKE